MKDVIKQNRVILIIYSLFLILAGATLLVFSKTEIHLYINGLHSRVGDVFFKNITHLGDGIAILVLFVILTLWSFRKALIIGLSGLLGGLLAQLFKRFVFSDVPRPKPFFEGISELYFVPEVNVHTTLSLPSGHTATAFALFFTLALISKNKYEKLLFVTLAFIVGYSRMYLSQHFLIDIYLGSILGVIAGILIIYFFKKSKASWLDLSILKIIRK